VAEPDHDARRFASANCGLLGLRSFRCGALGTIDALTATSRNVASILNLKFGGLQGYGRKKRREADVSAKRPMLTGLNEIGAASYRSNV
jgi:hypothetical protein